MKPIIFPNVSFIERKSKNFVYDFALLHNVAKKWVRTQIGTSPEMETHKTVNWFVTVLIEG